MTTNGTDINMTMHLVRGMSSLSTRKRQDTVDMATMTAEWRAYNKDLRQRNLASMQFSTVESYIEYRLGKGKKIASMTTAKTMLSDKAFVRETVHIPSHRSAGGTTAKKESPEYSGDYIVGIATMHKSNMVAVGKGDCPISYSTMRRS